MRQIPVDLRRDRDPEEVAAFLRACREEAEEDGEPIYINITRRISDHVDPLVVLSSVYEAEQHHAYMENPAQDWAIAAAEAVESLATTGLGRFTEARVFAEGIVGRMVAVGDPDVPFAGPHFFCAFTFADEIGTGPFAPATVFLPRWQIARKEGKYIAGANLKITPDADVDAEADRLTRAFGRLMRLSKGEPAPRSGAGSRVTNSARSNGSGSDSANAGTDSKPYVPPLSEEVSASSYRQAVRAGLADIEAGHYRKIVLARARHVQLPKALSPVTALDRLRGRFPECYTFSCSNDGRHSFIGATPERLLTIELRGLSTEAIAGTAARGNDLHEDAALSRDLLRSEKDLREHQEVIQSILRRIEPFGLTIDYPETPALLRLSNVQHLHTPMTSRAVGNIHLTELAQALHPTPAVGGSPREAALARIAEIEGLERGLYAGALGWFDARGDGHLVVGIRSALIEGREATLFAGAGIVDGSDPEKETRETTMKFEALTSALL